MQYPISIAGVDLLAGKFTNGNPGGGVPASRDRAEDMNLVYDELIAIVNAASITPSEASSTQVRDAILALIKGGDYKDSVRVASTVAINLAAPGATIDAVAMAVGNRFLEKDNATLSARGIYIWNGAAVAATRALDADTGAELNSGAIIPVEEGAVNADTNWQLTTDGTVVIGTTTLTFVQMTSQFASSAEAQGLALLTKALSPGGLNAAFQGANRSITANGYQKLPGGLILQWGVSAATTTSMPVVYPIAFPTGLLWLGTQDSGGQPNLSLWSYTATGLSGFTAYNIAAIIKGATTINTSSSASALWFAIGY